MKRIGLGGLECTYRRPENRVTTEQAQQQRQRTAEACDHRRAQAGRRDASECFAATDASWGQTGLERPVISPAISVA